MAITHLHRLVRALGLVAALALSGAGCTIYPSVPSQPTYEADVRPIFLAHCTRCHGAGPDGGALNQASVPNVTYDAGLPITNGPYLTQFEDTCPPLADGGAANCNNSGNCSRCGAATYAGLIKTYVNYTNALRMPLAPAPALDDWELKVIDAWAANPICSDAAKPDPAICPGS
jgi:hypothetical protein